MLLAIAAENMRTVVGLLAVARGDGTRRVGTDDRRTTEAETEHLFKAAGPPKELWLVKGAAHVDLYRFNPKAYQARISPFLGRYLHGASCQWRRTPPTPQVRLPLACTPFHTAVPSVPRPSGL